MEESDKPKEYEKIFKLDRDVTLRIKLNKPVRDITLVIGRIVRVEAGANMIVYETGFLKKKKNRILRKLFFRKLLKVFPFLKKVFRHPTKKSGVKVHV
jgi:hypothetical protein